jgi:hypothetical protein
MTDPLLQGALLWRLQTMSESAVQLSDGIKSRHQDISTGEDFVASETLSSTDTSTYWTSS